MNWDSWLKRRRWEARMDAELRFHLHSQISDYVSQGLSREEAEARARREFGPVELAKDECRDERPVEWLDHLLRDVRYACRSLQKSPGFTATAVAALGTWLARHTGSFDAVSTDVLWP